MRPRCTYILYAKNQTLSGLAQLLPFGRFIFIVLYSLSGLRIRASLFIFMSDYKEPATIQPSNQLSAAFSTAPITVLPVIAELEIAGAEEIAAEP